MALTPAQRAQMTRLRNAHERAKQAAERYAEERRRRIRAEREEREQARRDAELSMLRKIAKIKAEYIPETGPFKPLRSGFFGPTASDPADALQEASDEWMGQPGLSAGIPGNALLMLEYVGEDGNTWREEIPVSWSESLEQFTMTRNIDKFPPLSTWQVVVLERIRVTGSP